MTPLGITRSVQSLQRLRRIARVLTRHGFGHVVDQIDLGRFVPLWLRRQPTPQAGEPSQSSLGRRLTQVANELGPIFVKLGQTLASRPDILPPDVLVELRTLQDHVDPFDSDVAMRIIADELRVPVAEAFQSVDDQPIASGSIGQVHGAVLPDGTKVVIKVRRPKIDEDVRADLQLLKWLADALERWNTEIRVYQPAMMVEEFERALLRELDYMHEAATTARLHDAFADDDQVDIPNVIWSHTTPNVLTLEAVEGENIDDALACHGARLDKRRLAVRLADLYLRQFFEIGTFHADPHAGNILVRPPARVALVDFGQIGIISDELAGQLVVLLLGAVTRDAGTVADALAEMGVFTAATDRTQLVRDMQTLLDKYHGQPARRLPAETIFAEVAENVRRHTLQIPRDVVLMLKSLSTVWSVALRLDPDLDLTALLRPRLMAIVRRRLSPRRIARTAGVTAWHVLGFMKSAPQQFRDVLRQLSSGQWQLNIRHENLETLSRELDRSSNRLAFSIIIAAIVMGSSLMVCANSQVMILGVSLQSFGVFGYLFAGVLGLGLLWAILRSGRLS